MGVKITDFVSILRHKNDPLGSKLGSKMGSLKILFFLRKFGHRLPVCLLFWVDIFRLSPHPKIATICLLKSPKIGRHMILKIIPKITKLGQKSRFYEPLQQASTGIDGIGRQDSRHGQFEY